MVFKNISTTLSQCSYGKSQMTPGNTRIAPVTVGCSGTRCGWCRAPSALEHWPACVGCAWKPDCQVARAPKGQFFRPSQLPTPPPQHRLPPAPPAATACPGPAPPASLMTSAAGPMPPRRSWRGRGWTCQSTPSRSSCCRPPPAASSELVMLVRGAWVGGCLVGWVGAARAVAAAGGQAPNCSGASPALIVHLLSPPQAATPSSPAAPGSRPTTGSTPQPYCTRWGTTCERPAAPARLVPPVAAQIAASAASEPAPQAAS